jgi:hypothetical protein
MCSRSNYFKRISREISSTLKRIGGVYTSIFDAQLITILGSNYGKRGHV